MQLTCTTIHGETDEAAVAERHRENQRMIPERDRVDPPPCYVVAIFASEDGSKLELVVRDWGFAATLRVGGKLTLNYGS